MNIEDYRIYLKELLVKDKSTVLSNLVQAVRQNTDTYDNLIILQSSLSLFKREIIKGALTSEERGATSAKLDARILLLINDLDETELIELNWINKDKIKSSEISTIPNRTKLSEEKFQEIDYWGNLVKIGRWSLDSSGKKISGQGVYQFLLSSNYYGGEDFTIYTRIKFNNYQKFASKILDNANSGIILGWITNGDIKRYYNLLFTGKKILLEGVGLHGGDDYVDFIHLDVGTKFVIEDEQVNDFTIRVSKTNIEVFIDDEFRYSIRKPDDLVGRVGLRPWRSKIECEFFEVSEKLK